MKGSSMHQQQIEQEKTQPGWKIGVGIVGFLIGLTALLLLLKMLLI